MRRNLSHRVAVLCALVPLVAALVPAIAPAQSGSWITNATGAYNWSDTANWQSGVVADGANNTATFANAGPTGTIGITLDSARTLGALVFDNPTNTNGWTVAGANTLMLSNAAGPTIAVNKSGLTARMSSPLAGTQGFTKTGPGKLSLTANNASLSGGITINSGTVAAASVGTLGTGTVTLNGGILSVAGSAVGALALNNFGPATNWSLNGSATFAGANQLQITPNSSNSPGSAWYNVANLSTGPFGLSFTYTVVSASATPADGFTVGFQNAGLTALGTFGGGGSLGYAGINPSAVVEFNIYPPNTAGGVGSGTGVLTNGANPAGMVAASTSPVNMGLIGSPTNVTITYDGASVRVFLVQGSNIYGSPALPVNIAGVLGSNAIFGFTGATGGSSAQQQITNLQFGGPGTSTYSNGVIIPATPATIQVAATPAVPAVTLGRATFAIPAATLTVAADPGSPANQPFSLTFDAAALNAVTTFNVVNNGTGAGSLTLSAVSDGASAGSLVKTGSGTLILPAANTYTGPTAASGGILRVANSSGSATGAGPVSVSNRGTLAGGDGGGGANPFADSTQGFIAGAVTVQAGGTVSPGINDVGLLTINGGATFQPGSTFAVGLATNNRRIGTVPSDVNTNGRVLTPLDILFGGSLIVTIDGGGQSFTTGSSYDYFIGRDAGGGLPTGETFIPTDFASPPSPGNFALTRSADGQYLILTFTQVPEPGSLALVGAAVAGLAFRRHFRRPGNSG